MEVTSYKIIKENKDILVIESYIPARKKYYLFFGLAVFSFMDLSILLFSNEKDLLLLVYITLVPFFILIYILVEKKIISFDKTLQEIVIEKQYLFFKNRKINKLNYSEINSIRLEYESGINVDVGNEDFYQVYLISKENKKISIGVYDSSSEAWYVARKVNSLTGKTLDNEGRIDKAEFMNKIFFVAMYFIFVIGSYATRELVLLFLLLLVPIVLYIIHKVSKK